MPWRDRASLTPDEARQLHREALVIDTQQPPATHGLLFTEKMRAALAEYHQQGLTRDEATPRLEAQAIREIQTDPAARQQFLDVWARSGVTIACGTYGGTGKISEAFERAVRRIAQAQAVIDACDWVLVRDAADIEAAHSRGTCGIVIDFQDTLPIVDDLDKLDLFHGLGLRMVQLTYNLQNLVGDGCTETQQGGLTTFGRAVVQRLNELKIVVDVSHCSEQVGWDALKLSKSPIIVSHSCAKGVVYHDRGKTDDLARAVCENGGYFGVVVVPGFISERAPATLDDFCRHVEHLVRIGGIDHVGIGTDKAGPGSGTNSLIEYPEAMPNRRPWTFDWAGFRTEEHRLTSNFRTEGFDRFDDWPNLTVALANWGFNEDELRKLLGLNYLRVFRDVVG